MEYFYTALSAICAFTLGACPFSVWIGRRLLGKDIRNYGDGNPGATNVFRAGGRKSGFLAVLLDVAKGIPFVFTAHSFFKLPDFAVMFVAWCAISGHAFSPLLRFKGGKSIAVTFGVILALPDHGMLLIFTGFLLAAFLCIDNDAWLVIIGTAGSLIYLLATQGISWEPLFMLGVFVLFLNKFFIELKTAPAFKAKPIDWLQSVRRKV